MGNRALVQSKIRKAFIAIGDLALNVTIIQSNANSFDFSTLQANKSGIVSTVIKAVFLEKRREESSTNVRVGEIIINSQDVDDLTKYDRVLIESLEWKIVEPIIDNGYTVTATVTRNANG